MDHGEDDTATVNGGGEGVAVVDSSVMTCPAHKTQSSLIHEEIMANKENRTDETCNSSNSVFMEDRAVNTNKSVGSSTCLSSPFRR